MANRCAQRPRHGYVVPLVWPQLAATARSILLLRNNASLVALASELVVECKPCLTAGSRI